MAVKTMEQLGAEATLRSHVKAFMKARNLSKAEMARRLKVSDSNLGRQLSGGRGMSVAFLVKVRAVLHKTARRIARRASRRGHLSASAERSPLPIAPKSGPPGAVRSIPYPAT